MMKDKSFLQNHWNRIFTKKADEALGWYESDVSYTLNFFPGGVLAEPKIIFIAGAGTSQLVDSLLAMGHRLVLNDISETALDTLRERLGEPPSVHWLPADLSKVLPDKVPPVDIWIDRAVLHFLTTENAIAQYFASLHRCVHKNGLVLLAEFAEHGVQRCAGLPVRRYSLADMNARMVPDFTLIKHADYDYVTPAGGPRPYLYAMYEKRG